jgi:hypothetical protein
MHKAYMYAYTHTCIHSYIHTIEALQRADPSPPALQEFLHNVSQRICRNGNPSRPRFLGAFKELSLWTFLRAGRNLYCGRGVRMAPAVVVLCGKPSRAVSRADRRGSVASMSVHHLCFNYGFPGYVNWPCVSYPGLHLIHQRNLDFTVDSCHLPLHRTTSRAHQQVRSVTSHTATVCSDCTQYPITTTDFCVCKSLAWPFFKCTVIYHIPIIISNVFGYFLLSFMF